MPTVASRLQNRSLQYCSSGAVNGMDVEAVLYVLHEFARSPTWRCGGGETGSPAREGVETLESLRGFYAVTELMSMYVLVQFVLGNYCISV